jgi:GNAT superfamily N-acetyltransferase
MNAAEPPASDLIEAMVGDVAQHYGRIDVPGMPTARPEEFGPPGGVFLVGVDEDGRAVAAGGVKRLEDGVAEIKRMYVAPEARGRGLARELLVALEDAARSLGYARVRLDTGPKQPAAEHLYRSAGYREIPDYNGNFKASFWGEKTL